MPNKTKYTAEMVIGKRFGKLLAVGPVRSFRGNTGKLTRKVFCKCDCGNEKYMNLIQLCKGEVTSCGCNQEERKKMLGQLRHLGIIKSKGNLKDGRRFTRLYSIWNNMNNRCMYPSCDNYKYYGGRGIKVCYDWNRANKKYGWENFKNWAYNNGYTEEDHSLEIDRIDHDGDYEPSNCRFTNRIEQNNNTGSNVLLNYGGIVKTATEWATALNVSPKMLLNRVNSNYSDWTDSEILSIPPLLMNQNKDQYIKEHGIRPYIMINNPLYEAKYQKPFFDNEVLKKPLP